MRRSWTHLVTLHLFVPGLVLSVVVTVGCGAPEPPSNVVLIVADTLRADSVSINGHPVELTPTLDALARESVNFTAAYAPATWTKPSMASLFTGSYPDTHGLQTVLEGESTQPRARRLQADMTTLAERFQAGGFTTAAFGNQPQLQEKFGFQQGFEHYSWSTGQSGWQTNQRLRLWLETGFQGRKFIYLHYLDPHWPYWQRSERVEEQLGDLATNPPLPRRSQGLEAWLAEGVDADSLAALRAQYDHGVAVTDNVIRQALGILSEHGILDDAIVVVTSDHGEGFGEHGKLLHGYEPYEEVLRVPLILRAPERLGFRRGTIDTPVGLVDVMPTLLEVAGLEMKSGAGAGWSLVPLLRGEGGHRLPVYSETLGVRSLVVGESKLIQHPDGRIEYYDLAADPLEQDPMPCDEDCEAMGSSLDAIVAAAKAAAKVAEAVELDEADLERLRALGYLDD